MSLWPVIESIAVFTAFMLGGRNIASYHDLVKFNAPKSLRLALFFVDVTQEKINLMSIVYQVTIILTMAFYMLNFLGVNVFEWIGDFSTVYRKVIIGEFFFLGIPLIIYACFCEIRYRKHSKYS